MRFAKAVPLTARLEAINARICLSGSILAISGFSSERFNALAGAAHAARASGDTLKAAKYDSKLLANCRQAASGRNFSRHAPFSTRSDID